MKFIKEWKYIKIILLIVLIFLIIYKLNGDKELFQNNNDVLKQEISALLDITEDRIENLKVSGVEPNISISYNVIPRDINDTEAHTLESLEETINNLKKNMNYQFTIDGTTHTITNISMKPVEKSTTKFQELEDKFIDPGIDKQIKHLKDVKNYIKDGTYIKYDNPMDRFYEFDENGNLKLENELLNIEPQTEAGVLDDFE